MVNHDDEVNEGQIEGFDASTLPDKDKIYFNDYATLMQQQAMLLDHVRTSVYHFAIQGNQTDFEQKVVLDVGAGTGLLSFFAAHAGASRVYAVEASGMARHAQTLAEANDLAGVVHVLHQKVEEVTLDERVDVLVSEPLGIALVNERMLESYLVARDNLLKPGGKMFPDKSSLFLAPFSDAALYAEQQQKSSFWVQKDYYGIDLSSLHAPAEKFYFSQPVVGHCPPASIISTPVDKEFDYNTLTLDELRKFDFPFAFEINSMQLLHGFALWFDCSFPGSKRPWLLSTAPSEPLTHWYQTRCMLRYPIAVAPGHTVVGRMRFVVNEARGYNIHLEARNIDTGVSAQNLIITQCALHHFAYTSQSS